MTLGELKQLLANANLPDDAPVLFQGRYCFHRAKADIVAVHPANEHHQYSTDVRSESKPNAVAIFDSDW